VQVVDPHIRVDVGLGVDKPIDRAGDAMDIHFAAVAAMRKTVEEEEWDNVKKSVFVVVAVELGKPMKGYTPSRVVARVVVVDIHKIVAVVEEHMTEVVVKDEMVERDMDWKIPEVECKTGKMAALLVEEGMSTFGKQLVNLKIHQSHKGSKVVVMYTWKYQLEEVVEAIQDSLSYTQKRV
jgi:hypothetical protein